MALLTRTGIVALTLTCAAPALAGPDSDRARVALEWNRAADADECIDAAVVAREVDARLERSVFEDRAGAEAVIEGSVGPAAGGGWEARIRLLRADGTELGVRELRTEAGHCSSFDETIVLVVALMADVTRERVALPEPPPPEDSPPSAPAPAPAPPDRVRLRVPKRTHAPRQPWRFEIGASVAGTLGRLPGPAAGVRVHAAVEPPQFWLTELSATAWLSREERVSEGGAAFEMRTVGLSVCPLGWGAAGPRLHLCLGQRVGALEVEGLGFDRNRSDSRLVLDVTTRARLALSVAGPLELRGALGADVPVVRDRFVFRDEAGGQRQVYRAAPVAPYAALGVGGRF